jgi:hypothetical protein
VRIVQIRKCLGILLPVRVSFSFLFDGAGPRKSVKRDLDEFRNE